MSEDQSASTAIARAIELITVARRHASAEDGDDETVAAVVDMLDGMLVVDVVTVILALARIGATIPADQVQSLAMYTAAKREGVIE